MLKSQQQETATLGAGCFWCLEAILQRMNGVIEVKPGYTGGVLEHPTYEQICDGQTGHAEVTQIQLDTAQINFAEILDVFFMSHDPTTLNRQGNDIGTQYRSVIYFENDTQKTAAEAAIERWNKSDSYERPIVTEVSPLGTFYPAESHHSNYYNKNPNAGYCTYIIRPKLQKLGLEIR